LTAQAIERRFCGINIRSGHEGDGIAPSTLEAVARMGCPDDVYGIRGVTEDIPIGKAFSAPFTLHLIGHDSKYIADTYLLY
jgi:hypothetical protein